jgi:hypothetical protein
MSDSPLDEQKEAEILAFLKQHSGFELRSPIFKARKDFFDALIDLGMPKDKAAVVIGRMEFLVGDKNYGGVIYEKLIEISANNIFNLWKLYSEEIDESVFLESCRQYKFCPPVIRKKEDGETEEEKKE